MLILAELLSKPHSKAVFTILSRGGSNRLYLNPASVRRVGVTSQLTIQGEIASVCCRWAGSVNLTLTMTRTPDLKAQGLTTTGLMEKETRS